MKALTFASVIALGLAGFACSEAEQPETTAAAAVQTASQVSDDGFNLPIPGEETTTTVSDDGFNLPIPADDTVMNVSNDGFNLPTSGMQDPDSLLQIPAVESALPALESEAEADAELDDEPVIRLE